MPWAGTNLTGGTRARVSRRFKIPLILRNVSKSTNEMATKE